MGRGVTGKGVRIAVLDTGIDPTHPDLDDQDFRNWSDLLPNAAKIVDARNFIGGAVRAARRASLDGHGHGTHVAGIATGTGEGTPLDASDNGRYAGIAPDAELAVGKVLTDAGAGINSDLIAAMEWAAMPADAAPLAAASAPHIVNLSLGSESRPARLNTGSDVDLVSLDAEPAGGPLRDAVRGCGRQQRPVHRQPSSRRPGSAAQALSVGAAAKDYDLNHDDTLSGDTCAGYQHPSTRPPSPTTTCDRARARSRRRSSSLLVARPVGRPLAAAGHRARRATTSSRRRPPTGARSSARTSTRARAATRCTRPRAGTSMAAPATAGSAALLLQAYRERTARCPSRRVGQSSGSRGARRTRSSAPR